MDSVPRQMSAVLLTGHGGFDKLDYRDDVPVPQPGPGEVLIRVRAAGINNTDINTRIGWYSKSANSDTGSSAVDLVGKDTADGSWTGRPLPFPLIQGADVCGEIVAVGTGVATTRAGERVIVAAMIPDAHLPYVCQTVGSELDGAFAQYVVAPARATYAITNAWSDVELAAVPCAYSTAENALHRAQVIAGERILITGASGGVGSAAIQLAKQRGATVIAVCGAAKADRVAALGADEVVHRGRDLVATVGKDAVDVVFDVVAGPQFPQLLAILRRGGCYVTVGAIAGPLVELDVRTLYLKDLRLLGSTYQPPDLFQNLVARIERSDFRPRVAATYPLRDIVRAQQDFLSKRFVGKLVLLPD